MADCDEFPELYFEDSNGNMPWDYPSWNDEWEDELCDNGHMTVKEWNSVGRSVKKGEKGTYLPCAKTMVFCESQTTKDSYINRGKASVSAEQKQFKTFNEAISWAKANPGRIISRLPDGNGFITKR